MPKRHRLPLVAVVASHDHVAHNSIVDAQNTIKLCNLRGIGMEVDQDVVTLGQVLDLVCQLALAPVIDVVNAALGFGDDALDARLDSRTGFLVECGGNEIQQFISLNQLTSFGLNGPGLVKALPGQENSLLILANKDGLHNKYSVFALFAGIAFAPIPPLWRGAGGQQADKCCPPMPLIAP